MSAPKLLQNVKFLQKCIVVNKEGKILALRRDPNDNRRPNCWDFPGGNYEQGEGIDECIKREIREETSLIANSLRPIYVSGNMGKIYGDINVIAITQLCVDWSGTVQLSSEHVEFRWVTPAEFMSLETGDDGGFLKDSIRAYLVSLNTSK